MELIGVLSQILPAQSGVSQSSGKAWQRVSFLVEQPASNPQYPSTKVCFSTMSEPTITALGQLQIGTQVKVAFSVESREYNGRWYNDIKAFKIEQFLGQQQMQQQGGGAASVPPVATQMQGGGFQQQVAQPQQQMQQQVFNVPVAPNGMPQQQPAQNGDLPF